MVAVMASIAHVLCCLLLPLLARAAPGNDLTQVLDDGTEQSKTRVARSLSGLPNPLPPALLLHVLAAGDALGARHTHGQQDPLFLLQQYDDLGQADFEDSESSESSSSENEASGGAVTKRVFCNGFTGCGGRHRDRSRRQKSMGKRLIPVIVGKRPFCNTFGCLNGGKKRSSPPAPVVQAVGGEREEDGYAEGESERLFKRLFCNGYGGCRSGKRSLFSPWMSKMKSVAEGRR